MNEGVLEAGRAVRPYLQQLVGPAAVSDVDSQIAKLFADGARGADITEPLRAVLDAREATSAFLEEVLADGPEFRPPDLQPPLVRPRYRGLEPLAGDVGPVLHGGRYACPQGDFVWYRPSVGTPVAACPTHGPGLAAAQG